MKRKEERTFQMLDEHRHGPASLGNSRELFSHTHNSLNDPEFRVEMDCQGEVMNILDQGTQVCL